MMKINQLVETYVSLRDKKAGIKAEYDAKVGKLDQVMDKIEQKLLEHFSATGSESVRTESGTAYRSIRTTASVADRDAFLGYVKNNDAFELLESRCSKKAVEEFVAANDEPPPGINIVQVAQVNVRRSA